MKTQSLLLLLSLLVIQDIPAAERSETSKEPLIVVGSPPTRGTINGISFEHCSVPDFNIDYDVYICHRNRRPTDFKAGERIEYGYFGPVTDTEPGKVIDRILLSVPTGDRGTRSFYEVPPELVRDVTEPSLGKPDAPRTRFSLVRKGSTITIFLTGGDGAYSYLANWIMDLESKRVRRVLANGEGDEGLLTSWQVLNKIEEPKIVKTLNKDG